MISCSEFIYIEFLPFFSDNKRHAWCLHNRHVLCLAVRTVVGLLWHHASDSKGNHRLGTDSVLDVYDAVLLGFQPVCVSGKVNRRGAKLGAALAAVSDYLLQYGWNDSTFLATVAVRSGAHVRRVVPPVGWDGRATSAGSCTRE